MEHQSTVCWLFFSQSMFLFSYTRETMATLALVFWFSYAREKKQPLPIQLSVFYTVQSSAIFHVTSNGHRSDVDPLRWGICDIYRPSCVILIVADAEVLNKLQVISKNHTDSAMTISHEPYYPICISLHIMFRRGQEVDGPLLSMLLLGLLSQGDGP